MLGGAANRGLKPTATIVISLRDLESRSDHATVAVDFSPRSTVRTEWRRGATPEGVRPGGNLQPSLRDGTMGGAANRGLKPTATFRKSLRDCDPRFGAAAGGHRLRRDGGPCGV